MIDFLSYAAMLIGLFFFVAGTLGIWRLPDTLCRLHAVTKADNLGLGLIILGLMPHMDNPFNMLKLLLIWLLVLAASATGGQLIARYVNRQSEDHL